MERQVTPHKIFFEESHRSCRPEIFFFLLNFQKGFQKGFAELSKETKLPSEVSALLWIKTWF